MGVVRLYGNENAFRASVSYGMSGDDLVINDSTTVPDGNVNFYFYANDGYAIDRIYYVGAFGQETTVSNGFSYNLTGAIDLYVEVRSTSPIVTVNGDVSALTIYRVDGMGQEIEMIVGENPVDEGINTFIFSIHENYELIRAYKVDSMGNESDIESPLRTNVDSYGLDLYFLTEVKQPDRDVTGFNKLYKVDSLTLQAISKERFMINDVDLAEYFLNILELPFSLDESLIGEINPIRLGTNLLDTTSPELLKDSVEVDLGVIYVPKKYNNSYDYLNTTVTLHLPYTNSIELEIEYVIGYYIGVRYMIDLYSGDVTINISSSRTNKVILSQTTKIGRDIPFIKKIGGDKINQLGTISGVDNGVLIPYIELIRNKIHDENNMFNGDVTVYDKLSNVSGYVSVSNIMLSTNASTNEKDMIINTLRSGVVIK